MLNDNKIPGPTKYSFKEINRIFHKSPSFKIGKESRNIEAKKLIQPGPGDYNYSYSTGPSYTLISRKIPLDSSLKLPGPGSYSPNHMILMERSRSTSMGFGLRINQTVKSRANNPGPDHYNIKSKSPLLTTKFNHLDFRKIQDFIQ